MEDKTLQWEAFLARIAFEPNEMVELKGNLTKIFSWIDQLSELNVERVEPLVNTCDIHHPEGTRMVADVVSEGDCVDEILHNAPKARDGYFLVPKVVE